MDGAHRLSLRSRAEAGACRSLLKASTWLSSSKNDNAMKRLIGSGFELGADASAAAGTVGRHASADTNWKLDTEILTDSLAKGAFAGVTLSGASIRRDEDSTEAIYGRDISTRRILQGGVAVPV
jgi:SH3 domain-containing YSC84-like protein 1